MHHAGPGTMTRAALAVAVATALAATAAPALAAGGTRTAYTVTAEHTVYPTASAGGAGGNGDSAPPPEVTVTAADTPVLRGGPACVSEPSTGNCPTVAGHLGPGQVPAVCQQVGQQVDANGNSTSWWTWITPSTGDPGFVSDAYLSEPEGQADIPRCAQS